MYVINESLIMSWQEESDDSEVESEQTDTRSLDSKHEAGLPGLAPAKTNKKNRQNRDWEILEGLRDGQRCEERPERYEGFMMKRRKWPMKGWHKVSLLFLIPGLYHHIVAASFDSGGL